MDLNKAKEINQIQDFYSGSYIFITGVTGFLGLTLLEKLLRSCPNISKIYVFIRKKKGENVNIRLEKLTNDVVFERLDKQNPNFRNKLHAIEGDCSLPDLGINIEDRTLLIEKVNVIFHAAATIRFNEKLKVAVALNVRATRDLLVLARQMQNLKAVVHISTAYANYSPSVVDEIVYPSSVDANHLIYFAENMPERMLERATPMFLDKHVNTYSYTKQVAENVIKDYGNDLPVGIVRPSIIVSAFREPIRSWTNSLFAANFIMAYASLGFLRVLNVGRNSTINMVPVDMCVNLLIATAWEISTTFRRVETHDKNIHIPVYTYDNCNDQPITWGHVLNMVEHYHNKTPFLKSVWYFCVFMTQCSKWTFQIISYLLHILPAYILDAFLICLGIRPRMLKMASKVHVFVNTVHYFGSRDWCHKTDNYRKLLSKMSPAERETFIFDLKELSWEEFFESYVYGMRKYLMKELDETIPTARKKYRRLFWMHQVTKILLGFVVIWLTYMLVFLLYNLI